MNNQAGKGNKVRPFNRKKWDEAWEQYEKAKAVKEKEEEDSKREH